MIWSWYIAQPYLSSVYTDSEILILCVFLPPQVLWLWSGGARVLGGLQDFGPGQWKWERLLHAESAGGREGSCHWHWHDWGPGTVHFASRWPISDTQCIQKVFRPFVFFHILLCCSLMLKSWLTQYTIMTKRTQNFIIVSTFLKEEKLKYHIDLSIQPLHSVLHWSTVGSVYSIKLSWVWGSKLYAWIWVFFGQSSLQILSSSVRLDGDCQWTAIFGLGSSQGSGWGRVRVRATPALSWLCA